jgi:ABC-type glycerol-3-phosphate transport system permease component
MENVQRFVLYLVIIVLGLLFIFPFLWMALSSLKNSKEVLAIPIRFFPTIWNWQSYVNVFTMFPDFNFPRFIVNSFFVTGAAVLLCLFFSATAGYGFAKYRFRGNNLLFTIVLATIMITFEAIIVPLYILVRKMGISNTYWGLIIPESLTAFGVFMMRQFFYALPDDFMESARIDGANEYLIFARIGLPMAKTALLALVIFHAQWVWNLLLWPMILISNPSMRVLPQGIALFKGGYNTPYPEQLAVSVIACLPLVILYIFLSKYFVQGITLTGLKG